MGQAAYEIRDFREGLYLLGHFKGTTETVNELDRVLKITDSVLRHMIVRKRVGGRILNRVILIGRLTEI